MPDNNIEKPERMKAAITAIKELKATHPALLDISSDPPEVDNRYLMVVHDTSYIKRLIDGSAAAASAALDSSSSAPSTPTSTSTSQPQPAPPAIAPTPSPSSPSVGTPPSASPSPVSPPTLLPRFPGDKTGIDFSDVPLSAMSFIAAKRAAGAVR